VAYDEDLAHRVRALLPADVACSGRPMFGGLAFLVGGNMAVAVSGQGGLLVRVDPAEGDALVATTGAVPMEMRGRPMRGWLRVDGAQLSTEQELSAWVERGVACAGSLPSKGAGAGGSRGRRTGAQRS
jgi:TfoX/Sxy family transcriptional regulator of competence genes